MKRFLTKQQKKKLMLAFMIRALAEYALSYKLYELLQKPKSGPELSPTEFLMLKEILRKIPDFSSKEEAWLIKKLQAGDPSTGRRAFKLIKP